MLALNYYFSKKFLSHFFGIKQNCPVLHIIIIKCAKIVWLTLQQTVHTNWQLLIKEKKKHSIKEINYI